jgi:hypothetical protein
MKAAVVRSFGQPLVIEERPDPEPGPGQVRIRVEASGLCHLVRWTRLGPEADSAVDGVPEYAFGPRKRDGKAPVRDFAGRRPVADRGTTAFEYTPHLALLSTPGDGPADWLRAGQALERVLLEATAADLATSLTSHALETPELRMPVRDPGSGPGRCRWCCVSATARGARPPPPPGR